jgi:nucleotide-binding universal stress UspA family protein
MTRIVVPVDFSETSKNAAEFAVRMAGDMHGAHVTLYNCFDRVAAGADGTPLSQETATRMQITLMALQHLKERIDEHNWVRLDILAEEGPLLGCLEGLVQREPVDMVVMGINGATRIEQILIGSTTLGLVNKGIVPVMIIPPDARYRKIRKLLYASDMKNVETTTPVDGIRQVMQIFGSRLAVGHVENARFHELPPELKAERENLNRLLGDHEAEYHFLPLAEFTEAINTLADEVRADLVITVPRKHRFLDKLFTTSHTKKLAYHSHLPVLALPLV